MFQYIPAAAHYTKVLSLCGKVRHDLWIATADLLDSVWQGLRCAKCNRKAFCGDRISK